MMDRGNGFIDLHQHVLFAFDDGAETPEESLEMLRRASAQNVRHIAVTPHACPGFVPFDKDKYAQKLSLLQAQADRAGIPVTLLPGAEIAYTYQTVEAIRSGRVPTINNTEYALIELWPDITWAQVREASLKLLRAGISPVFAHVERYRCFLWQPEKAIRFKAELPVYYQMNAGMLIGKNGIIGKRFLRKMLSQKAIDIVASDAHDLDKRRIRLDEAYSLLKEKVPAAYAESLLKFDGVLS
ncbi:MAG: hypothetical protein IIX93_07860 [Clostridia bacterium]|nr:hypothetical protein [Clostridia bacterium]